MSTSQPPRSPGVQAADTLPGLFQARVRESPGAEAYRQFSSARDAWLGYSWSEMAARVLRFRAALQREMLQEGDRIAILLPNGIEHVCADQAALCLGLVPVPLHVVDNPENLGYVIADSGSAVLFVESFERWSTILPFRARLPLLRRVVYCGPASSDAEGALAVQIDAWLASVDPGAGGPAPAISPDALAAIVYTSGTTGRPKGVMLSHGNVMANIRSIMQAIQVLDSDVFLSFLPLSHTFERTVGYYLPIAAGASVAFARSIPMLMEDLRLIRPTILVSVPRIYERAYATLRETVGRNPISAQLFAAAVRIGLHHFEHAQGRASRPSGLARAIFPLLDRLVGYPVRQRFGGRLRAAVTGGAPMALQIARPFLALGVPVLQGYGMTESSPVISCNTPQDNDPASVGRALPGIEVRIGEQQELLARGDNVMVGYWQRAEETSRVREADGWLHTGDQASIEAGRIHIKGRIKDIIVTSTGEKVSPVDLEAAIVSDPVFEQAMVLGEGRPYLAALVVLNRATWEQRARELGMDSREASAMHSPAVLDWLTERIRQALRAFPGYAMPRVVLPLEEPWTVAGGLITPTLKPKRAAIEARYAAEIAGLYRGH
ncbi:MAG TPA: AMP-dependent synthetase/ligase [Steroidobacteraceae bacterium]|nr:AMP-dependent synthetase/ligase [Steroidobacteraceae bacterium]